MTSAKQTLIDLADKRGSEPDQKTAYRFLGDGEKETATLNFQVLREESAALAEILRAQIAPGERALIFLPSGPEFVITFYACLRARIIAVPAYTPGLNQAAARIETIVADAEPAVIITDERTERRLSRSPSHETSHGTSREINLADIPVMVYQETMTMGRESKKTIEPAIQKPAPEDIAFLQYTSGSTMNPRGVRVSHGNLMSNSAMIRDAFEITRDSVIVSWLPLFHDMGLIGPVLQPVFCGSTSVIMPPAAFIREPIRWLRAIQKYGVEFSDAVISGGPDFAYKLCAEKIGDDEMRDLDLSAWRTAFNGAEPVRPETCERFASHFASAGFRRDAFLPCYGMAEATLLISGDSGGFETLTRNDGKSYVSCGRFQWGNQDLKIVHPVSGDPCEDLEIGEIQVRGAHIADGYWRRETRDPKSRFPTGDLGFVHEQRLYVAGRIKDVIIVRGRNYYPDDLERIAEEAHPDLRSPGFAAAFTLSENSGAGESVVLAVEVRRDARDFDPAAAGDAISAAILKRLELALDAVYFLRVNGIPRTSSGKIQRGRTAEMIKNKQASVMGRWPGPVSKEYSDPAENGSSAEEMELQEFIVNWLARRLRLSPENVDRQRPMTVYGLDSIIAVEATNEIEKRLGLSVEPWALYEANTVASFASYLKDRRDGKPATKSAPSSSSPMAAPRAEDVTLPAFASPARSPSPVPGAAAASANTRGSGIESAGPAQPTLTDFEPYRGTRVVKQEKLLDYTAWMLAAVECVREGVEDPARANELLDAMREKVQRFGVSPEYIAARQINVASRAFVEKPMQTKFHELPYLHRNLLRDVRGEPLEARIKFYEKVVLRIAELWYPRDTQAPNDLVHVTCSGYLSPGPLQKLAARRSWLDTTVVNSYQMDCYGAFPAVRIGAGLLAARDILRGPKKECVDIVHTEFASLHCDFGSSEPGNIVNLTLFGDGFIKYSVRDAEEVRARGGRGLKILAAHEQLIPDTHDDMTWGPGSYQFNMFLSKNVPLRIREVILPFVRTLCENAGIDFHREKAKLNFVIHPGGPRILDHIRDTLEISEEQTTRSREVLRRHGNMSSATVPHIWKDILEDPLVEGPIISMAFGPGLTATGLVLEKI